jgi:hypothetical protein
MSQTEPRELPSASASQPQQSMTRAHAAYVLGHGPWAVRLYEEVGGAKDENTLNAVRQLSLAIHTLRGDIHRDVLPGLEEGVRGLGSEWAETLGPWCGEVNHEDQAPPARRGDRQQRREEICALVEEALPADHPLHELVRFGFSLARAEFVEYAVIKDRWLLRDGSEAGEQQLPDLGGIVSSAERLPCRILASLPEVGRLITFGPRLQDVGVRALVERVLEPRPGRIRTFAPVLALTDFFLVLDEQIQGHLKRVADEPVVLKPRWDQNARKLWYGTTLCASYAKAAPNQTRLLESFEELGWPTRMDDPLDRDQLRHTIEDLQRKLKDGPIIVECDGTKSGVCWRLRPTS